MNSLEQARIFAGTFAFTAAVAKRVCRRNAAHALDLLGGELASESLVALDFGNFRQVEFFLLDFATDLVFHQFTGVICCKELDELSVLVVGNNAEFRRHGAAFKIEALDHVVEILAFEVEHRKVV